MTWFKKISKTEEEEIYEMFGNPKEWTPGILGILSHFTYRDFSVVRIIPFEDIAELSGGYYKMVDEQTIQSNNPFGGLSHKKKDESVPCMIIDSYGSGYATNDSNRPGTVHMVGAQNLYKTLMDLLRKQFQSKYMDMALQISNLHHIQEFLQDYPQMKGQGEFTDLAGDYQIFTSDHGYEIQIFKEDSSHITNPYNKLQIDQAPFYWYMPELNKRSLDYTLDQDPCFVRSKLGMRHYATLQECLQAAEKYLDCLFSGREPNKWQMS